MNGSSSHWEKIVPLACVIISFMIMKPWGITCLPLKVVILIHLASYLALGVCFELPELSFNALCLYWATSKETFEGRFPAVAAIMQIRYVLTHFIGPVTGTLTVASGIYLAYRGAISFSQGWLFWILIVAAVGLYKGMYQHNLYVKYLLRLSRDRAFTRALQKALTSRFDQCLIFLELPTYLFIFWAASAKPAWFQNPWPAWTLGYERATSIWAAGMVILAAMSMVLLPIKWGVDRFSAARGKAKVNVEDWALIR